MAYRTLGWRPATAVVNLDPQQNPGNYSARFQPSDWGVAGGATFEVYHISILGPAGSTFQVFIDNVFYDNVARGDINSWDPNQPMLLSNGNYLWFYWNVGTGTPVPAVTLFLREGTEFG
jgi:hypothetical protein